MHAADMNSVRHLFRHRRCAGLAFILSLPLHFFRLIRVSNCLLRLHVTLFVLAFQFGGIVFFLAAASTAFQGCCGPTSPRAPIPLPSKSCLCFNSSLSYRTFWWHSVLQRATLARSAASRTSKDARLPARFIHSTRLASLLLQLLAFGDIQASLVGVATSFCSATGSWKRCRKLHTINP
jgi:hypothetical protein